MSCPELRFAMPIWPLSPVSLRRLGALSVVLFATHTAPAWADRDPRSGAPLPPERHRENPSPITDHFSIEGIFFPLSVDTTLRLDPSHPIPGGSPTGTLVSGERDLGLANRLYQGRIELMLRLRKRNRVFVDFEDVTRSASPVLTRQIQFGNEVFDEGEQAVVSMGWRIFTITYAYSVYRSDWLEVGTGLALNLVQAQAQGDVAAQGERQDVSTANEFPTIPLDVTWLVSRRIALTARAQYFGATVGTFSGSILDLRADAQYRLTPNFALGVGYSLERISVELHTGSFPGLIATDVKGAQAFFRVSL